MGEVDMTSKQNDCAVIVLCDEFKITETQSDVFAYLLQALGVVDQPSVTMNKAEYHMISFIVASILLLPIAGAALMKVRPAKACCK